MNQPDFHKFLEKQLTAMRDVLDSKSADYSNADDKLYNFKLAAKIDGVSPIEALRGMWLKHRTSIVQGLDDLQRGVCRPEVWWNEKLTDDRNYGILLQALLAEAYFQAEDFTFHGVDIKYKVPDNIHISKISHNCYIVCKTYNYGHKVNSYSYLWHDLELYNMAYGAEVVVDTEGYYSTRQLAEGYLRAYLRKQKG